MAIVEEEASALLSKVALGDRGAFKSLYLKASPKLFAVCVRMMKNRHDAEEALQEVFVRIWQKAAQQASSSIPAIAWMVTVARNLCIDRLRTRKGDTSPIDEAYDLADEGPDPEKAAVASSEAGRMDNCIEQLDAEKAGAVRGAYLEGYSYQELAERYKVPINTMRTWLRRSLLSLRACLDGRGAA